MPEMCAKQVCNVFEMLVMHVKLVYYVYAYLHTNAYRKILKTIQHSLQA